MATLLQGEGLRWQEGAGQLDFTLPVGARAVTVGGDAARRAAFRALITGRLRHFSAQSFTAGTITWRGKEAGRLSRRGWRRWQQEAIPLATDPRRSLLPSTRVERLLREVGSRGEEAERWLEMAGLPPVIRPWPVRWLSTAWRLRLLMALALARRPALIVLDDFAARIAGELWSAMLAEWMQRLPREVALVVTLQSTAPPLGATQTIPLDF